jgi:putative tryptophan/tyrosine transport system substrate-binding protein
MMRRRTFIASTVSVLAAPLDAEAQQAAKVARVAMLGDRPPGNMDALRAAFQQLGRVVGQNLVLELRWAEGRFEQLPGLAKELVDLNVDVIITVATPATLAAKNATNTIPIVFVAVADPVAGGFVASLARPGGNLTGVSSINHELAGKRLELLKEAIPAASRVAVLWHAGTATDPVYREWVRLTEVGAKALGVQLHVVEVRGPTELGEAFAAMARRSAQALLVISGPMLYAERRQLADLALKKGLPTMFGDPGFAQMGGLMDYAPNPRATPPRVAAYVDKILKGAKPADLPVEQPTKFDLVINLKTAKAMGLTIPPAVLARADEVIQ